MSEQNPTVPDWFRGGTKLYRSLLELAEWHPEATEIATCATVPDDYAADTMLHFLSDELMRTGFTDNWAVTPHGQEIEDLIDVFNDLAQPERHVAGLHVVGRQVAGRHVAGRRVAGRGRLGH
ncbi:hypothetical protein [Streptomyces sp. NRRL S-237]|uniref:hypothetical protein n=1 Tax=Streptomyces sp. NRRL S-237 TaxID=1463895 RepID=UPI0004C94B47|nr:hypothetical protein [Streptomyces sp. NRRL S-237]